MNKNMKLEEGTPTLFISNDGYGTMFDIRTRMNGQIVSIKHIESVSLSKSRVLAVVYSLQDRMKRCLVQMATPKEGSWPKWNC